MNQVLNPFYYEEIDGMEIPSLVIGFDNTNRKSHVWCSIIVVGGKQLCLIKQMTMKERL